MKVGDIVKFRRVKNPAIGKVLSLVNSTNIIVIYITNKGEGIVRGSLYNLYVGQTVIVYPDEITPAIILSNETDKAYRDILSDL